MSRYEGNSPTKVTASLQLPIGTICFITWLVFLIIKLTSNPTWLTWFWVWFPFWLPWAILGANIVIILIVALILAAIDGQHMSRVKVTNTDHSYYRAAERCGWGKKKARDMMKAAQRYGKMYGNLPDGELRNFLRSRQVGQYRRIKYYAGYIFVFASTSTRCITVYPYPKEPEKITG